jgi:hypothetical protein
MNTTIELSPELLEGHHAPDILLATSSSYRQDTGSLDLKQVWHIYKEDQETVNDIIELCEQYQNETISATQFLGGVRDKAVLIYPGKTREPGKDSQVRPTPDPCGESVSEEERGP